MMKNKKNNDVNVPENGTEELTKEKLEELFKKIYNENKELFDRLS